MSLFGVDIAESCVHIFGPGVSKREALDRLIDTVVANNPTADGELFRLAVYQREAIMSTGIGGGVAIPHVRFPGIPKPMLVIGISAEGVDYGSLDNEPVHVMVLFAMPEGSDKQYLDVLARVMMSLKRPGFFEALVACGTPAEAVSVLHRPAA
ncbi:MAG TPA: PTS sugar transporter subunit IIA [Candidatus Hydrogenedentes bacterium]|nr:PTS sugar transporter subunit IIA [Candidatus Hydrogenedentota bacterium]HPG68491.1 PTS sugar transporter subunit IIA [Candidatus Hydrogenedentota bacterium]